MDSLTEKIYFLLDACNLWESDGSFTFPDGDVWYRDEGYDDEEDDINTLIRSAGYWNNED
jgi:hypothetical protein